jgi:hypothetical protein
MNLIGNVRIKSEDFDNSFPVPSRKPYFELYYLAISILLAPIGTSDVSSAVIGVIFCRTTIAPGL